MLESQAILQLIGVALLASLSAWIGLLRFRWTRPIALAYSGVVVAADLFLVYLLRGEPWTRAHLIPATIVLVGVGVTMALSEQFWRQYRDLQGQLIAELERELRTARDMQMRLMPRDHPQVPGFDISGRCVTADQVGGDFFQYFDHGGRLALTMADVTGHAMAAAIPVVLFDGVLESQIHRGEPTRVLFSELNRTLHRILDRRTFVCFAMGELDPVARTLRFCNGGCPYPYHFRSSSRDVVEVQVDGYPLGVRPDTAYEVVETQLHSGDRVVFCSDGFAEAPNASGEQFGYDRTEETIREACIEDLSAEETINRLLDTVAAFRGDAPQSDDMTCVVLRVEETSGGGGM